ncbi:MULTISPECIES: hypothetical protein [unclassified Enterococcus]|uniref:hypothetical protein n=1 Tax=unclassified Enterococcus TaxID=2608891 RepID=UPI0013EC7AEB|nr:MULTISPECIES: hypothetical protein [unclassified Enterococcus]
MNTYIEVTNGAKTNYFYAFVEFKESMLVLSSFQGLNQSVVKKINLDEITGLVKDTYWGGQRISFSHQGTIYQFFECGPAVVDYLQENLFV